MCWFSIPFLSPKTQFTNMLLSLGMFAWAYSMARFFKFLWSRLTSRWPHRILSFYESHFVCLLLSKTHRHFFLACQYKSCSPIYLYSLFHEALNPVLAWISFLPHSLFNITLILSHACGHVAYSVIRDILLKP